MNWIKELTGRQKTILIVAWLGWVFDIMDTALFNFAKGPMLTEMLGGKEAYKLQGPAIEGQIQSVFLVGWAIGGFVFGLLADRWGRSRVLIITILMYSCLTGLTALCQTPEQVMVLRFLTALGIGGEWAAGAALVAETVPEKMRASAAAFLQSAAAFGPWLAASANLAIPAGNWKALFILGVVPAFVCVVIRFFVREPEPELTEKKRLVFAPIVVLFSNPNLRRNLLIAMTLGVVGVTGAGIVPFWLPNMVSEAMSLGYTPEQVKNFQSYNTFTLHLGTLAGVILFPWLCNKWGRRPSFALFFVGAMVMTFLTLNGHPSPTRLLVMLPLVSFFTIGLTAGFALYFPELFPPSARATGSGLAYNAGRIFSAPMPAILGAIVAGMQGSVIAAVLVGSAIYLLGLLVLPFAKETKDLALPKEG